MNSKSESKSSLPAVGSALGPKRLRTDDSGQRASGLNGLRLVNGRVLPLALEHAILSFLDSTDVGAMPFLSKDMLSLVKSFFASVHTLTFTSSVWGLARPETFVWFSMLRHTRQLRVLDVSDERLMFVSLAGSVRKCVLQNRNTFEQVRSEEMSLPILAALAACPNLTAFSEDGYVDNKAGTCRRPMFLD